jgi:peptidoglycan-N-acetylglucosamine deacetylase
VLGSHGYDHGNLNAPGYTLEDFHSSLERNEALISTLPGFVKRYRFPFLKEGETEAKRDGARKILTERGYLSGGVSIDASDWYFDQRLRNKLASAPGADPAPYRRAFLAHIRERAEYYQGLAEKLGRPETRHVLLLHHSLLNALFLDDLLAMFRDLGWELIDAREAYTDPLYATRPKILPAGESVLWALAREKGLPGLRYPGEDGEYERAKLDELGL